MSGTDDRLDRVETAIEQLTADVAELRASVADLQASVAITDEHVRTLVRLHTDSRDDIHRLYAAWPEHLRHDHQ